MGLRYFCSEKKTCSSKNEVLFCSHLLYALSYIDNDYRGTILSEERERDTYMRNVDSEDIAIHVTCFYLYDILYLACYIYIYGYKKKGLEVCMYVVKSATA